MSGEQDIEPRTDRTKIGWLEEWGAPTLIIITSAGLILVAWFLWRTTDQRSQGAALALVGVVTAHLVKEVQELVRFWLKR
jgi:hypothetical protein